MIKELFLPLDEAANVAKCSERAILQRGAEGTMPIYVLADNYEYTNVVQGLDPSFDSPLNGRQQVMESSLADYLNDPEARLNIVHYEYNPSGGKEQWGFLLFPPVKIRDSKLVVMTADLKTAGLLPNDTMSSLSEYVDDPRWPEELDIAIQAWLAACREFGTNDRPKKFIEEWLTEHYPAMKNDAVRRICTVANWNKDPGRSRAS